MLEKIRVYSKITNLWAIARRYFVNNFYDGMLTVLGILLGFFALILKEGQISVDSHLVILTGVGSSISMFISGITGSYLSEKAEQKKIKEELKRAMIITEEKEDQIDEEASRKEIEKAMLTKIGNNINIKANSIEINTNNNQKKKKKRTKNIQEKAERFASIIVAFVNGLSPFLGGLVPLFPFFYAPIANFSTFIISFSIILICIILLGVFLGVISKESIVKNILQMVFAFTLTLIISIFLLG
ncbi:MAG: VIT1/CCC1 transporter family protein [Candidatus Hodarchaeota archaeon]